jgi:hypothetical protein
VSRVLCEDIVCVGVLCGLLCWWGTLCTEGYVCGGSGWDTVCVGVLCEGTVCMQGYVCEGTVW